MGTSAPFNLFQVAPLPDASRDFVIPVLMKCESSVSSGVRDTHELLHPTTIISLLHDSPVEIIEIELPLEGELVKGVKEVESERRFGSIERRGIPTHPQKLAVMFYPAGAPLTSAELDVQMMRTIEVNDEDGLLKRPSGRTRGVLVTNVEAETQFEKADTLIKTVFPYLPSRQG
jgi:hypothetical protein